MSDASFLTDCTVCPFLIVYHRRSCQEQPRLATVWNRPLSFPTDLITSRTPRFSIKTHSSCRIRQDPKSNLELYLVLSPKIPPRWNDSLHLKGILSSFVIQHCEGRRWQYWLVERRSDNGLGLSRHLLSHVDAMI